LVKSAAASSVELRHVVRRSPTATARVVLMVMRGLLG
jgi:hypothetical protein